MDTRYETETEDGLGTVARAGRTGGVLESALSDLHQEISMLEEEVAMIVSALSSITQPIPESDTMAARPSDPSPPRSPATYTTMEATYRIGMQRARLSSLRSYLDVG